MPMYNETCECRNVVAEPQQESLFNLLGQSYEYAKKALDMATQVNVNLFGKPLKESKADSPHCMRDAVAQHVDDLKALCEELNEILMGLGV